MAFRVRIGEAGTAYPVSSLTQRKGTFPARAQATAALAVGVFAVVWGVYAGSLGGPFAFDDRGAIVENPTLRALWPPWGPLSPPPGATVSGRPILNFSLAVNYALGGQSVRGYHATNVLIHALACLVLFGLVRRTLLTAVMRRRFGRDAVPVALATALLWAVHPLQTEAVTYVVQRAESLAGLFYLLTLYAFVRSAGAERPLRWQAVSVAACLLGMGTKEVMATAPVVVLLYDRTFCAGTFLGSWRKRRGFYLGLAATWVPLALLVAVTYGHRPGSPESTGTLAPAAYWLTQFEALARYLRLSLWPRSLVFDYGPDLVRGFGAVALDGALVMGLLALTVWALRKAPALGFLGACFFIILAPTTLVPVATQAIAEHRMYLPLACVMAAATAGAYAGAGRASLVPLGLAACLLSFLTVERNRAYASGVSLWADTVAKRPGNARAHCSLGQALAAVPGRAPEAIAQFEEALRLHPRFEEAQTDLASVLETMPGRLDEAIAHYEEAARQRPDLARTHNNLGLVLAEAGLVKEADREYEAAIRINPAFYEARANRGILLCSEGDSSDGIEELEAALRIRPTYTRARFYLANAWVQSGRIPEAIEGYEDALRDEPNLAEASNNLGMILCRIGRTDEGMRRIEAAIRMQPDLVQAHFARAAALMQAGRTGEAASEYETVLKLRPDDPSAERMLQLIHTVR